MELDRWDYDLPQDRVAVRPTAVRDGSRLLHLDLESGSRVHREFTQLVDVLRPGDLLVANDTRVMAARLRARRATGGAVELLVLGIGPDRVPALIRPARRIQDGEVLRLAGGESVRVVREGYDNGQVGLEFDADPIEVMAAHGEMPLPPYLKRPADAADVERYQTVFAGPLGAAAAPTAGLHFTSELQQRLRERDVQWATITLHVGIGTFQPLRPDDVTRGELHPESWEIPTQTVQAIAEARARGGRVVAVGTTTVRTLETATLPGQRIPKPGRGTTRLFIRPPYTFRTVDGLVTNFHLPGSSLLMLVGALCGRDRLMAAYKVAIHEGYRFYSYGDAMLLI